MVHPTNLHFHYLREEDDFNNIEHFGNNKVSSDDMGLKFCVYDTKLVFPNKAMVLCII